jgi:hypothetical protein
MSWLVIHEKALKMASDFKKSETSLIDIFQQVEKERVFMKVGKTSVFQYGVEVLKLTKEQTYLYLRIARASSLVPAFKVAIENNSICLSNAKKIASVITAENQSEWILKGSSLTTRQLEKEIVKRHPELGQFELRRLLTEEGQENLMRALDLIGKKLNASIETILKDFVSRHDPIKKASRSRSVVARQAPAFKNGKRTATPQRLKNLALKEANGQCVHVELDGIRCPNTRFLQVHHCENVAYGGKHELSNFRVLCSSHHLLEHV